MANAPPMSSPGAYKLVLLGDGRVGKTSLVSRFVDDRFDAEEASTTNAKMFIKKKVMVGTVPVEVAIWDTCGQERFHALGPLYYRKASGAVLVYDITDTDSFDRVKVWVKELKKTVGDNIAMVLCGNKSDLEKDRTVDNAVAEKYAKKQRCLHFLTSARHGTNVENAFMGLIQEVVERDLDRPADTPTVGSEDLYNILNPGQTGEPKPRKKGARIDLDADENSATQPTDSFSTGREEYHESYFDYNAGDAAPQATKTPRTARGNGEQPQQTQKPQPVTFDGPKAKSMEKPKKKCDC